MAKVIKYKNAAPSSSKKMPVLSLLYGFLILGAVGLAGWIYWLDRNTVHEEIPSAQAEISHAVAASDTTLHKDVPDPSHKAETAKDPHHTDEKPVADPHEENHSTDSTDSTDLKHVTEPATTADLEHTTDPEPHSEPPHKPESEIKVPSKAHPQNDIQKEEETEPVEEQHTEKQGPTTEHQQISAQHKAETKNPVKSGPQEASEKPAVRVIAEPVETGPLPSVPDPELAKISDFGLLPIIGPTGRMPWRTYGRPFDDPLDRPRIAIVISEMGMSSSATQTAIQNLPGSVTLSFNPYARDLQSWVEQSRAAGHEVLLQLPMEPYGYPRNDPGPHSLLTSLTDRENLNRLEWMLGRFTGYSGVTNQMGSRFTASAADIQPILHVVKNRGLLFMDGRTSSKSVAGKVAADLSIPVAVNNRFLDHKADRATIDARLGELERIARYTGTAIGIGYPYPVTLERLAVWAQTLARKGFVLAPISAVINRQEIQ